MLAEYKPLIKQAFAEFVNQQILSRMGIQPREQSALAINAASANDAPPPVAAKTEQKGEQAIVTTDRERALFHWVQQRLAFLVGDDRLFKELEHVMTKDLQGKFVVYYRRINKGRLLEFYDRPSDVVDRKYRLSFPDDISGLPEQIEVTNLEEIDEPLLKAFKARVSAGA